MKVPYVDIPGQYRRQRKYILSAIDRTLAGGWYILGREVEQFESRLAREDGMRPASKRLAARPPSALKE